MFLIVSRFEISKKKKIRFFETAKVDDPLKAIFPLAVYQRNVFNILQVLDILKQS